MVKIQAIIGVENVQKSSEWYQTVFGLKSGHGGDAFEMLQDDSGNTVLFLHVWEEHEHPTLSKSAPNNGNGLILYMNVKDLDGVWSKAKEHTPKIEFEPQLNKNSGQREFAIRDLDGYYLLVSL